MDGVILPLEKGLRMFYDLSIVCLEGFWGAMNGRTLAFRGTGLGCHCCFGFLVRCDSIK